MEVTLISPHDLLARIRERGRLRVRLVPDTVGSVDEEWLSIETTGVGQYEFLHAEWPTDGATPMASSPRETFDEPELERAIERLAQAGYTFVLREDGASK